MSLSIKTDESLTDRPQSRSWFKHLYYWFLIGILLLIGTPLAVIAYLNSKPNHAALAPEALERGDLDEAERQYQLGLKKALVESNHFFIAIMNAGLGDVSIRRKDWKKAETQYESAILEFKSLEGNDSKFNDLNLSKYYMQLAMSQLMQKKCDQANGSAIEFHSHYEDATRGIRDIQHLIFMASFYHAAAGTCHNDDFYWQAISYLHEAESYLGDLRGSIPHVQILRAKASIMRDFGKPKGDPGELEIEANRMEKAFRSRSPSKG